MLNPNLQISWPGVAIGFGGLMVAFYILRGLFFLQHRQRLHARLDAFNTQDVLQTQDAAKSCSRWDEFDKSASGALLTVLCFWKPFHRHYSLCSFARLARLDNMPQPPVL